MDESWRLRLGSSTAALPRRRSTEHPAAHRIFDEPLGAEDFHDVFGGPPRTVLARKTSASDFRLNFHDVFRSPERFLGRSPDRSDGEGRRRGVYERGEGFYDDIFGSDEERRAKSRSKVTFGTRSKSRSSSVLSSEDLSPLRPSISEDAFFTNYSSKLRPVNIPSQRNASSTMFDRQQNVQVKSETPPWLRPPPMEPHFPHNNLTKNYKCSPFKFFGSASSPETISIEPNSSCSIKSPVEDIEIDSPDSPTSLASSLCNREPESKSRVQGKASEEDDEDDIMSSYVIEINSEKRKEAVDESAVAIDEAIAWAKEKFQRQNVEATGGAGRAVRQTVSPSTKESIAARRERFVTHEHCNQQQDGYELAQFLMVNEKLRIWMTEEKKPAKAGGFS